MWGLPVPFINSGNNIVTILWNGARQYNLNQRYVRCPPSLWANELSLPPSFPCAVTTTIIMQFWTSAHGIQSQWFRRKIRGDGWISNVLEVAMQDSVTKACGERALPFHTSSKVGWWSVFIALHLTMKSSAARPSSILTQCRVLIAGQEILIIHFFYRIQLGDGRIFSLQRGSQVQCSTGKVQLKLLYWC